MEVDPRYFRPAEVDLLLGDAGKARTKLGWAPKVDFDQLVKLMVEHDLARAKHEAEAQQMEHAAVATKTRWGSI